MNDARVQKAPESTFSPRGFQTAGFSGCIPTKYEAATEEVEPLPYQLFAVTGSETLQVTDWRHS